MQGPKISLMHDYDGNLLSVEDGSGQRLEFTLDIYGRIVQVSDGTGRSVAYKYDLSNDLVQVTDSFGASTTYTYDKSHRLSKTTLPGGRWQAFDYDFQGRLVKVSGGEGYLVKVERKSIVGGGVELGVVESATLAQSKAVDAKGQWQFQSGEQRPARISADSQQRRSEGYDSGWIALASRSRRA